MAPSNSGFDLTDQEAKDFLAQHDIAKLISHELKILADHYRAQYGNQIPSKEIQNSLKQQAATEAFKKLFEKFQASRWRATIGKQSIAVAVAMTTLIEKLLEKRIAFSEFSTEFLKNIKSFSENQDEEKVTPAIKIKGASANLALRNVIAKAEDGAQFLQNVPEYQDLNRAITSLFAHSDELFRDYSKDLEQFFKDWLQAFSGEPYAKSAKTFANMVNSAVKAQRYGFIREIIGVYVPSKLAPLDNSSQENIAINAYYGYLMELWRFCAALSDELLVQGGVSAEKTESYFRQKADLLKHRKTINMLASWVDEVDNIFIKAVSPLLAEYLRVVLGRYVRAGDVAALEDLRKFLQKLGDPEYAQKTSKAIQLAHGELLPRTREAVAKLVSYLQALNIQVEAQVIQKEENSSIQYSVLFTGIDKELVGSNELIALRVHSLPEIRKQFAQLQAHALQNLYIREAAAMEAAEALATAGLKKSETIAAAAGSDSDSEEDTLEESKVEAAVPKKLKRWQMDKPRSAVAPEPVLKAPPPLEPKSLQDALNLYRFNIPADTNVNPEQAILYPIHNRYGVLCYFGLLAQKAEEEAGVEKLPLLREALAVGNIVPPVGHTGIKFSERRDTLRVKHLETHVRVEGKTDAPVAYATVGDKLVPVVVFDKVEKKHRYGK